MENLVDKALMIACRAHAGQLDKGLNPYILHPLRLAVQFSNPNLQIVALLHDVVEDSDITLFDLRSAGFNEEVLVAVAALTKKTGEDYEQFIRRISINGLAVKVKIADLRDNMDIHRLSKVTGKDFQRLIKYKEALTFLESL